MGNGNIEVGNQTATRKPGKATVERLRKTGSAELRIEDQADLSVSLQIMLRSTKPKNCGAMAQQRCDSGRDYESVPQEFVRLVGFRDPNASVAPWIRPDGHPSRKR